MKVAACNCARKHTFSNFQKNALHEQNKLNKKETIKETIDLVYMQTIEDVYIYIGGKWIEGFYNFS